MNYICAGATNSSSIVVTVIIVVMLIGMLVFPYFTQRKKNQEYTNMISSLKVGDLVRTAGGVIGKITKITDKGEIKTVILETGSKTEKSYMEFDMSMIYCVLKSTKVDDKASDETEENKEENKEEIKQESKASEVKTEEPKQKGQKTTSTKTATKKTGTKKTTKK